MANNKIYEIITNKIIQQLEDAIVSGTKFKWIKGWNSGNPPTGNFISYVSNNFTPYRGINQLLLDGLYLTYNQLLDFQKKYPDRQFHIKQGCKKHTVYFYKMNEIVVKNEDGEEELKTIPLIRFYNVFSYKDIEGLEEFVVIPEYEHSLTDNMQKADAIIKEFCERDSLIFKVVAKSDRCFYKPSKHEVSVPPSKQFKSINEYYSTVFHELVHATSKTLGREVKNGFGSEKYSFEELVAEIGSQMLCNVLGIADSDTDQNSIAYLQSWLKHLKENEPSTIVKASTKAQQAVDLILCGNTTQTENVA